MKIPENIYSLISLLLLLVLTVGCRSNTSVAEEKKQTKAPSVVDKRGFNPLDLPLDTKIIPKEYPLKSDFTIKKAISATITDSSYDSSLPIMDSIPETMDTLNNQVYRIQIFTSKVYGDAKYATRVADEIFDRQVYLDYEVPYYKVRVGNFANREQAEEYLLKVKTAGYTNAWVVMVTVNVNETTPLYENNFNIGDTLDNDENNAQNDEK
ncbi:MAG: SPOR domain-containing protein [FCB group bacterium]|nr:SPOR domain-containing protein [FCB group bacterium]